VIAVDARPHSLAGENRRHLVRETLVSILINAVLSALFVWLVFGGRPQVELWDVGRLALDFIPQTFVITLMATLVPSAITRKRLRDGKLTRSGERVRQLPRNLFLRGLLFAVVVTPIAVGLSILALSATWNGPMAFVPVLVLKVLYGGVLALLVTSFTVRAALADG
jgi:hypothetical protein